MNNRPKTKEELDKIIWELGEPFMVRYYVKRYAGSKLSGKVQVIKTVDGYHGNQPYVEIYFRDKKIAIYIVPFFGARYLKDLYRSKLTGPVELEDWPQLIAYVLGVAPVRVEYYGLGEWGNPKMDLEP